MSWLASFVVAFLTGVVGLLLGGFVASLAVSWHRISSFEGGSGYFVIGMALLGFIGGAIVGLVTARMMAPASPSFLRVLGTGAGIVVAAIGCIGGISRATADIDPTIDGAGLYLAVELRWPAREARAPGAFAGEGYARLDAGSPGNVQRGRGAGILFVDDARQEDGRWVVPGIANVWTSRGQRLLEVGIGDSTLGSFIVPLPAQPGPKEQEWSDWLPHARPGAAPLPDQFTYRFRVVKVGTAMRTQHVGPFEVATLVEDLFHVGDVERLAATSSFHVTYKGGAVASLDTIGAVAELPGATPALLVRTGAARDNGACVVVQEEGGQPKLTSAGDCGPSIDGWLLTSDTTAWHAAYDHKRAPGWLDRTTFATPGLYLLSNGVLDTRAMRYAAAPARTFAPDDSGNTREVYAINGLPPLALAPDESSYVWYGHAGDEDHPVLVTTRWSTGASTAVAIDRPRMRYTDYRRLDPAWVAHHFEWRRGGDGALQLAARAQFTPLPYVGVREVDAKGVMSSYYLKPGGTELRNAIVDAMVQEFGAERLPDELNGYHRVVRLDGRLLKAANVDGGGFVSIGMDFGTVDSDFMKQLADRLDRLVASGKFDALFHVDPKPVNP
ncbi:MAG: hypothetical protein U0164_18705 [Gemmatimonadaceae bacterium]